MAKKVASLDKVKALSWENAIASDDADFGNTLEGKALKTANAIFSTFFTEDWVFITVDLLARQFSSPYLRVQKKEVNADGKTVYTNEEGHSLQGLLDNPTVYGDSTAFWYRAGIFDALLGNTFMWYMKASNKLFLIPSHEVTLNFSDKGVLLNYAWQTTNEESGSIGRTIFPREEVLHILRPNPASEYWGMSPFIPGSRSVLFNRYSEEFLNSFFEKGATPQIIIESEINNNPEAIKTLAKSFELMNTGRKNQRRPLVLPKGAKAIQMNLGMADAKMIELINQNREVILNLLNVPKHALGLQTAGSLGSEEHKTALRFMWQSTIAPMLKRYSTGLTKFFRRQGLIDLGYEVNFDVSDVEIATEDAKKKTDLANGLLPFFTVNEIRAQLWEADPIEGGDTLGGAKPMYPQPQNQGQVQASLSIPGEVKDISDLPSALPTQQKFLGIEKLMEHEAVKAHLTEVEDTLVSSGVDMEKLAVETLLSQLKKGLEVLKEHGLSKQKDSSKDELKAALESSFAEDAPKWSKEYREILQPAAESGYTTQLRMVFNPQHREALTALQETTEKGRKAILAKRALESFAHISETTSDKIISAVAKGVEEGRTMADISRAILETAKELTFGRAQTIARTETLTAVSVGQKSAIKNTLDVIPDAKKVWITAKDERVRGNPAGESPNAKFSHFDMHGVTVDAKDMFDVNGAMLSLPRDPSYKGDGGAVINCFVGYTQVSGIDIEKAYRSFYNGEIISVETASGSKFSVTPNHPILTNNGWIPAGKLTKGSNLFKAGIGYRSTTNINMDIVESTIEHVFNSLSKSSVVVRLPSRKGDLHGDVTAEYVDIVNVDGVLQDGVKTELIQVREDDSLSVTYLAEGKTLSDGGLNEPRSLCGLTDSGEMTGSILGGSLLGGHLTPFKQFSVSSSSDFDTALSESVNNACPGDHEGIRNLLHAHGLVDVCVDPVVSVSVGVFSGHVYNLQTKSGIYLAQGLVSHNCRCTAVVLSAKDMDALNV